MAMPPGYSAGLRSRTCSASRGPARAYLGPADTEAVEPEELLRRLDAGDAVVIDVRATPE